MRTLKAVLGYAAALLVIAIAVEAPFRITPLFVKAVAATGIRPEDAYTGGQVARTLDRGAWHIAIYKPVHRATPFHEMDPFIQADWQPVEALPPTVSEALDLDGDGKPDVAVTFAVPKDPKTPLTADVKVLSDLVKPITRLDRRSLFAAVARVGDRIVVRVPLARG